MPFVLDASVSGSWALSDETSAIADAAAERLKADNALVPHIWWYEVRNLLLISERRKRITTSDIVVFLGFLSDHPIQIDQAEDEHIILGLARQHHLSFYDAAYLAVALRHHVPLATLDKNLRTAALATGVLLLT
jgi:predicted nucleic acid-binding protein